MAHLCLTSCSWAALCSSILSWPRVACSFSLPPSNCCCSCVLRPRSCWFCCRTFDCSQLSCWILDSSFGRANRHVLFIIPHTTSLRGVPQGSTLGLLLFNVHVLPPRDYNTYVSVLKKSMDARTLTSFCLVSMFSNSCSRFFSSPSSFPICFCLPLSWISQSIDHQYDHFIQMA